MNSFLISILFLFLFFVRHCICVENQSNEKIRKLHEQEPQQSTAKQFQVWQNTVEDEKSRNNKMNKLKKYIF